MQQWHMSQGIVTSFVSCCYSYASVACGLLNKCNVGWQKEMKWPDGSSN